MVRIRARIRTSIARTRNTLVPGVDELGLILLRAEQLLVRVLQVQKKSFLQVFSSTFRSTSQFRQYQW